MLRGNLYIFFRFRRDRGRFAQLEKPIEDRLRSFYACAISVTVKNFSASCSLGCIITVANSPQSVDTSVSTLPKFHNIIPQGGLSKACPPQINGLPKPHPRAASGTHLLTAGDWQMRPGAFYQSQKTPARRCRHRGSARRRLPLHDSRK